MGRVRSVNENQSRGVEILAVQLVAIQFMVFRDRFYWDSFTQTGCIENKQGTEEDGMSRRMRRNQEIKIDC